MDMGQEHGKEAGMHWKGGLWVLMAFFVSCVSAGFPPCCIAADAVLWLGPVVLLRSFVSFLLEMLFHCPLLTMFFCCVSGQRCSVAALVSVIMDRLVGRSDWQRELPATAAKAKKMGGLLACT
jgi:hypothetical protein